MTFRLDNELMLTTLSLSRSVVMNNISNQETPYGLAIKLKQSAKGEQLAEIRERQR